MAKKEKIIWSAPRWSTVPKLWWELKKSLLSIGPIVRISLASLAACFVIVGGLKIAIPGIVIPNLFPLLLVFPALVAQCAIHTWLLSKVSARVQVTCDKISISHGESAMFIKRDSLVDIVLAIHDEQKERLRIRYMKNGKRRLNVIGVSDSLDLVELERVLALEITPRDYRRSE